jgi:serine/threonine protein kinase
MIRSGDEPIPGYRVELKLGRGQYGEVWRATAPGRSMVALKFLDMTGRTGWKEFRSVQRVKQIRHAHLMPIIALWLLDEYGQILTDDAVESLASEDITSTKTISAETHPDAKLPARMIIATLLGDGSLRDRLGECLTVGWEGIPVDELIGYMQEAAKGIDHLNSTQHDWKGGQVGVQHCDIKPDNILLTGGSIMICDFGVAQILADNDAMVRATSLSGSPAYMAPEAFEAKPSRASDQYSLAVTYYELRTGQLPLE